MALSGSVSTDDYDGRYYTVSWTATQDVTTNKSTIKWTLSCTGGDSSWYAERTLKVVVAGSTVYSKTARVERKKGTISSGTVTVSHNTSGAASFSISVQAAVYYSTVNCTGSKSFTLNTIPRKSTLAASNGTLDTDLTLSVTRLSTSFTHTITYKCGTKTGTICTKSSSTSIKWTSALGNSSSNLAGQNTTGTTVSVTFTITTYSGSTSIGSNTKTITMTIPNTVIPSCSIAVSDSTGYLSTYGGYVKGKSKFKVVISPTLAYNSPIASYNATANGVTYTAASFTTGEINSSGTLYVKATVKDKRGRTSKQASSAALTVLDYSVPKITSLKVKRINDDGTENDQGDYVRVTFSASVSPLNNKNSAVYSLKYKKSTESGEGTELITDDIEGINGEYNVTDAIFEFPADTGSSYIVTLSVTDDFKEPTTRDTVVSTGFTLMHWLASGLGMGIGKIAEFENTLDVAFLTRLRENVCIGDKTGYLDGYTGVYINKAGYMHLQRDTSNGDHPYIGFLLNDSTKIDSMIRYNYTNTFMQFLNAGGYQFDSEIYKINTNYIVPAYRVLYDNSTGTTGTVTLTETAANFKMLEIIVGYSDIYGCQSVKVYSPNGKVVDISAGVPSSTSINIGRTRCTISGTSITQSNNSRSMVYLNATTTGITSANTMYIKTVIGYL